MVAKKSARPVPARQGPKVGQMVRITDKTSEAAEKLCDAHGGIPRTVLFESVIVWFAGLDHEVQQLLLGSLAPDRIPDVLRKATHALAERLS